MATDITITRREPSTIGGMALFVGDQPAWMVKWVARDGQAYGALFTHDDYADPEATARRYAASPAVLDALVLVDPASNG